MKLNVYVDNNIIGGLVQEDYSDETMKSIIEIIKFRKEGKIEFWVSEIIQSEIEEIPEDKRYYHDLIYNLINNISMKPTAFSNIIARGLGPGGGFITRGLGGGKDELLLKLEDVFPKRQNQKKKLARERDINHLYQFKKNNLDIFWTEDKNTILNYSKELEKLSICALNSNDLISYILKNIKQ